MEKITSIINMTYEELFSLFILENTPLSNIDEMITEALGSDYEGETVIGKPMHGLDHFRLLSKAHTERLSESDRAVFERLFEKMNEDDIKIAMEVIAGTYKEVMAANPDEPDKMTCLGPYSDVEFCFDNDAIVLALVVENAETLAQNAIDGIRKIAEDMKSDLFAEISKDLNAKFELYVSID